MIIENGSYNIEYLMSKTNAPFLLNNEGKLIEIKIRALINNEKIKIISNDKNDKIKITISGKDENGKDIKEEINLNGKDFVTSSNKFTKVSHFNLIC